MFKCSQLYGQGAAQVQRQLQPPPSSVSLHQSSASRYSVATAFKVPSLAVAALRRAAAASDSRSLWTMPTCFLTRRGHPAASLCARCLCSQRINKFRSLGLCELHIGRGTGICEARRHATLSFRFRVRRGPARLSHFDPSRRVSSRPKRHSPLKFERIVRYSAYCTVRYVHRVSASAASVPTASGRKTAWHGAVRALRASRNCSCEPSDSTRRSGVCNILYHITYMDPL